jgi:tricorn protease
MKYLLLPVLALGLFFGTTATAQGTRLLRQPTVSSTHVAFAYANDLWIASRDGGDARRLTSFPGSESQPHFSPDGTMVAFTGQYDGNTDVYVVPTVGGEPRRLTWHPLADTVQGWSPDGSHVLFTSGRDSAPVPMGKFWTVPLEGGFPIKLLDVRAWKGTISPDSQHLAYQEKRPSDSEWRNYRGGQAHPIWVMDLADHSIQKLPWKDEQQWDPVWLEGLVYFLSDRDYAMNVYRYKPGARRIEQITHYREFDAKQLQAGGGVLVYEYGGYLHLLDPAVGEARQLDITVRGDLPWARPHWENVGKSIRAASISPTGKRALFEARGDIFSVPAEKGNPRNLTRSSNAADRNPSWSPDGQTVAWFSDVSGEYQLMLGNQNGLEEPRAIPLPNATFYYAPAWSPDSKKLAFTDQGLQLWVADIESGEVKIIDADQEAHPERTIVPVWSPDSRWLAYAKRLDSHFHAVFAHDLENGTTHQLTDGMSDARGPVWDAGGKYLYFLASTDFGISSGWLDMTPYEIGVRHAIYVAVLSKDDPSPFLPESDEEAVEEADAETADEATEEAVEESVEETANGEAAEEAEEVKAAESSEESAGQSADQEGAEEDDDAVKVTIDFEGLDQRILALSVPARVYSNLTAGKEGILFYGETIENQPGLKVFRYELKKNKATDFASGSGGFVVSADGEKMLLNGQGSWRIVGTAAAPSGGKGTLATSAMRMHVDPAAEWQQMFREAWRYQRDYLYVPNLHGANWAEVYQKYQPMVAHVGHRADLTYLLDILGGEVSVGHSFTFGGDTPDVDRVSVGMLGADITVDQGHYRIDRILTGENWNPDLRAPLSAPGVDVNDGDYLLEVDGIALAPPVNLYAYFEGTAGQQVVLTVADSPDSEQTRQVTVVPTSNEIALRSRDWVEANRRLVDQLSEGKLAYIWLPNTGGGGYTYFNRYYFAQQDRQGAVVDERFNGGGSIADYMVDLMSRDMMGYFNSPAGDRKPFTAPLAGIWGPKVMLINDAAGSGGDMLPYMFRLKKIGPLIGTRTWGGLVGIGDVPPLLDGGAITAPRWGFFDLDGNWSVENEGVAPDIEVEMTPSLVMQGHDPQLERAIAECLRLLKKNPVKLLAEPKPPIRAKRPKK